MTEIVTQIIGRGIQLFSDYSTFDMTRNIGAIVSTVHLPSTLAAQRPLNDLIYVCLLCGHCTSTGTVCSKSMLD